VSAPTHDWLLLGPSYRRERDGIPPRETVPVIQKYDTAKFVEEFLRNPFHSRTYEPEDEVYVTVPADPDLTPDGRSRLLSPLRLESTGMRKLYQPVHKRFYLAACELRCDLPGLPCTDRSKVCEAGFVVRRRRLVFPEEARKDAHRLLQKLAVGGAKVRRNGGLFGVAAVGNGAGAFRAEPAIQAALELQETREELLAWVEQVGAVDTLEGWVPLGDGIGEWRAVEERPQELVEAVFPLTPLIPDPSLTDHLAQGRTIYFGVLPTASNETTPSGEARFDDVSHYEVRCFVRRHREGCPKTLERGDCHGPLVWSGATTGYRIAAYNDPVGTSNTATTVVVPDVPALVASAAGSGPRPRGGGMKLVAPADSSLLPVTKGTDMPEEGRTSGDGFCFFAIPLITLVALFVLHIFLPILLFIFNLWALLLLRFCIPPSVTLGAELSFQLKLAGELGLDLDVDGSFTFDANAEGNIGDPSSPAEVRDLLEEAFADAYGPEVAARMVGSEANLSNSALATIALGVSADHGEDLEEGGALSLTRGLRWEDEL
jgi:hypothetical protein